MANARTTGEAAAAVPCEDIQALLFDYMAHELGDKQSLLVRGHLLHCEECRREAARMERTVAKLRGDRTVIPPEHLKSAARRRIERVILHPFLDFVYVHRHVVAAILALAIVSLLAFIAGKYSKAGPEGRPLWLGPNPVRETDPQLPQTP